MDRITYDKINEYCAPKHNRILVQAEKDYILRRFLDSYYQALDQYRETNGIDADEGQQQIIISSLLNESTVQSYIDSANSYYIKLESNLENKFRKKFDKPLFWRSVSIGILANLLYSIGLLILFFVAKNQITSWIMQLVAK